MTNIMAIDGGIANIICSNGQLLVNGKVNRITNGIANGIADGIPKA